MPDTKVSSYWEWAKRVVDLGAGVAVIATLIFVALQWHEMREGGKDTHDLAVAAKAQADGAKSLADSAKSQADNTTKLANTAVEQVAKLQAGVEQTRALAMQTKAANENTVNALHMSERPWVSVDRFEVEGLELSQLEPNPYLSLKVRVSTKNTGRSVAVRGAVAVYPEPNSAAILNREWRKSCDQIEQSKSAYLSMQKTEVGGKWPMGFVLTPGEQRSDELLVLDRGMGLSQVRSGFYVIGCIIYDDQYGGPSHHTVFCYQSGVVWDGKQPSPKDFTACGAFQEAN